MCKFVRYTINTSLSPFGVSMNVMELFITASCTDAVLGHMTFTGPYSITLTLTLTSTLTLTLEVRAAE